MSVHFSWRYKTVDNRPFDPRSDEFDLWSLEFDTQEGAVEFLLDFLDCDEVPDDYLLVRYTGEIVQLGGSKP